MKKPKPSEPPDNTDALVALYGGVLQKLEIYQSADTSIENKLTAILAGSLVVLTLLASKTTQWQAYSVLGAIGLVGTIMFCFVGGWPRTYPSGTVKIEDNLDYLSKQNRELLLQIISDTEASIEQSKSINIDKSNIYKISTILFIFSVGIGFVSFFVNSVRI